MGKQIGIRLNSDELQALRRIPGETDSARVRALIHNQSIMTGLALEISAAVAATMTTRIDQLGSSLTAKINSANAAPVVRKLAEQLNPILAELLTNTRKIR